MNDTRVRFWMGLKQHIGIKTPPAEIGEWVRDFRNEPFIEVDSDLYHIIDELYLMREDEWLGFAISYDRLNKIAEDVLAERPVTVELGKKIPLDPDFDPESVYIWDLYVEFWLPIKRFIEAKAPMEKIADWAYDFYFERKQISDKDLDEDLRDVALRFGMMEAGPEYALTYEQMDAIVEDLVRNREIHLPGPGFERDYEEEHDGEIAVEKDPVAP
jgi:hypothetical protein